MKLLSFPDIFRTPIVIPPISISLPPHINEPTTPPDQAKPRSLDDKRLSATKTNLSPLSAALNLQIPNHVADGSGFETYKALLLKNKTSGLLQPGDKKLLLQYRSLKALVPRANNIRYSEFASDQSSKILDLLGPKKRTAIVTFALDNKNPGYRTSMTTWLASGLVHLEAPDRNRVVDATLSDHEKIKEAGPLVVSFESKTDLHPSKALAELCKSFPVLDTQQRQRVIAAVLALDDSELKARLIGNLGEVMSQSQMNNTQRTSVVDAYLQLGNDFKHFALAGLATAIAQGQIGEHCDSLVKSIVGIGNATDQAKALGAFGPALSHLSDAQLADLGKQLAYLGEQLVNMEDEPKCIAIGELGPAIGLLNHAHREKLFGQVLGMFGGNIKMAALTGLTQALGARCLNKEKTEYILNEEMTKYIVDLTKHPHERIRAVILSNIGTAIAGMHETERPKYIPTVIEATLKLVDPEHQRMVLEAMGAALPSLDPEDLHSLVIAFLGMHDDESIYKVLRGFSQSLKNVSENQIPDVIKRVLSIVDQRWKSLAIGELGPMRDSLTDAQWSQLTEAVDEFKGVDAAVFKATALVGLHR